MKILIAADMEGISGVVHWDHVDPKHKDYPRFCKLMTGDVNAAIDETIATHPEWFDTSVTGPAIHAENVNDYMQSVTDILYSRGLCASGPGEELNVKFNNECCEAWDIVATPSDTEWLVRRYYVGNCLPSFF